MPIVLVRVDDRLIHGQVLEGWVPATKAQELVVANDALADDHFQRMIMESSIPDSVKIVIGGVDTIADMLLSEVEPSLRRMILVDNPVDALRLKKAGIQFHRLNLGNLRANHGRVCLSRSVVVGDESLGAIQQIIAEGVQVYIQSVPFENPLTFPTPTAG